MMIRQFDFLPLAGLLLAASVPTFDQDALAQGTTVPERNNQGLPAGVVPEPPTGTEITQQGRPGFVHSPVVGDLFEGRCRQDRARTLAHSDVRRFASRMMKDHTKSSQRPTEAVESANLDVRLPTSLDRSRYDLVERLRSLPSREYMRAQVDAHQQTLRLLVNYAETGKVQALQKFARDLMPMVQNHLRQAQDLSGKFGVS